MGRGGGGRGGQGGGGGVGGGGGGQVGGWRLFVDVIVVWLLVLTLNLIKSNVFSFGAFVTVKQPLSHFNICVFKMKSNLKHF